MKIVSKQITDTEAFAEQVLETFAKKKSLGATVIGLSGNLGAGKTTFTQTLAAHLGIAEHLTSPTFVIMKRYRTAHPVFSELVHIDAYRLKDGKELAALGFEEIVAAPHTLVLIEWPENVHDVLPPDAFKLSFEVVDETSRWITLSTLHK